MKQEKGITLVVLLITIVVMLIITSVAITSGTQSIDNTKLDAFYMQLDIVKKRVDDIATTNESYIDSSENTIYLQEQGTALTSQQQMNLTNIIQTECAGLNLIADNFRYFTTQELESVLELSDINYNVFIDFNTRTVIAEIGVMSDGVTYHISPNTTYFVEENANKNVGKINSLGYDILKYGSNSYRVTVIPSNTVGDLGVGTLKYKKSTSKYWETSENLQFVINKLGIYEIKYSDLNNNNFIDTIEIKEDEQNNLIISSNLLAYFHQNGTVCDTGIVANNRYTIEMDFEYINEEEGYLWGVFYRTDSGSNIRNFHSLSIKISNNVPIFRVYSDDIPIDTSFPLVLGTRYFVRVVGTGNKMTFELNNNLIGSADFGTVASTTYYLGDIHRQGYNTLYKPAADFLLYSFKIYDTDGTTLLCNYVPRYINGEVELYDTVKNQIAEWIS